MCVCVCVSSQEGHDSERRQQAQSCHAKRPHCRQLQPGSYIQTHTHKLHKNILGSDTTSMLDQNTTVALKANTTQNPGDLGRMLFTAANRKEHKEELT